MEKTNTIEESRVLIQNMANKLFGTCKSNKEFSIGDYVYYFKEEIGHIPCKVTKLLDKGFLELSDGYEIYIAKANDCELQEND